MRYPAIVLGAALWLAAGCTAAPGSSETEVQRGTAASQSAGLAADGAPAAEAAGVADAAASRGGEQLPLATVYKDPNCGCCTDWVTHVRNAGFTAVAHDRRDVDAIKRRLGVPQRLYSCHTAEIDGYVIEGHVPADLIIKLLTERPPVAGLAVPGMPMGSPGMEGPYSEPYEVIAFEKNGATSVYARR